MSNVYRKLLTDTITLPIIPYNGVSNNNTKYYALLEKNYMPTTSSEVISNVSDWCALSIDTTSDKYYNRLIVTSASANSGDFRYFTATVHCKNTLSDALAPCNDIYVKVMQAPYENLSAAIWIEDLNGNKITSTTNGNALEILIKYYITKNGVHILTNDCKLTLNGSELNPDNILLKYNDGSTIIVKYQLDENISGSSKTYTFKNSYTSKYGVVASATASLTLPNNNYNILLGIGNLSTSSKTIDYNTNSISLVYKCMLNGELIKTGYTLTLYNSSSAIIQFKKGTATFNDSVFTLPLTTYTNLTDLTRTLYGVLTYNGHSSSIITLTLNKPTITIKTIINNTDVGTKYELSGTKATYELIYYGITPNNERIILMSNTINNNTINYDLTYTAPSSLNITSTETITSGTNAPYKKMTFTVDSNVNSDGTSNTYNIKFDLNTITKSISLQQNPLKLTIGLYSDSSNTSTTVIGGLMEYNTVYIYFTVKDSAGNLIYDKSLCSIKFTLNEEALNTSNISYTKTSDYILATINLSTDYGTDATKNGEKTSRLIKYKIHYIYLDSSEYTITQYPVYFSSKIVPSATVISADGSDTINVDATGIMYNYESDKSHCAYCSVENVKCIESFVTIKSKTNAGTYTNALFSAEKNSTGSDRTIKVYLTYKSLPDIEAIESNNWIGTYVNIHQATVNFNAKFTCNDEEKTSITINPFLLTALTFKGSLYEDDGTTLKTLTSGGSIVSSTSDNIYFTDTASYYSEGSCVYKMIISPDFSNTAKTITVTFKLTVGSYNITQTITITKPVVLCCTSDVTNPYINDTDFYKWSLDPGLVSAQGSTDYKCYYIVYYRATLSSGSSFYYDTNSDHYTLSADDKLTVNSINTDVTTTSDRYLYASYKVPENKETNASYAVTVTYKNINIVGGTTYYNRTTEKAFIIELSDAQNTLYLAYDNGFNNKSKTINALAQNSITIYAKALINTTALTSGTLSVNWTITANGSTYNGSDLKNKLTNFTYKDSIYQLTFNLSFMTDSNDDITYTLTATWNSVSDSLTLVRTGITNTNAKTLTVLEIEPPSVPYNGEDSARTTTLTYYFKTYDLILDISDQTKLYLSTLTYNENNAKLASGPTYDEESYKWSGTYLFAANTDSNSNILKAQAICKYNATTEFKSTEETCTQGGGDIKVYIEPSSKEFEPTGGTLTIIFYGILNSSDIIELDDDALGIDGTKTNTLSIESAKNNAGEDGVHIEVLTDDNGNKTGKKKAYFTVKKNITETKLSSTFIVAYYGKTESTTISLKALVASVVLTASDTKVDGTGGELTFNYYGLKNNTRDVTNLTFVLTSSHSDVSIGDVYTKSDSIGNYLTQVVTFPMNTDTSARTYTFTVTYEYISGKTKTATVPITLAVGDFKVYILANKSEIESTASSNGSDNNELIITYYVTDANNAILNPKYLTLALSSYKDSLGEYDLIKDLTPIKTAQLAGNLKYDTFSYSSNTGEGGSNSKYTVFTVSIGTAKASVKVRLLGGDLTVLSSFSYLIFDYVLDNVNNAKDFVIDATVDNNNGLAGKDLDTLTIITANNDKDIYVTDANKNTVKLNEITAGFGCIVKTSVDKANTSSYLETSPKDAANINAYKNIILFSGDNTSSTGEESVYINFKNITNQDLQNEGITTLYCKLYGHWYNFRGTGKVKVTYTTYNGDNPNITIPTDTYKLTTTDSKQQQVTENCIVYNNDHSSGYSYLYKYTLMAILEYNVSNGTGTLYPVNKLDNRTVYPEIKLKYGETKLRWPNSEEPFAIYATYYKYYADGVEHNDFNLKDSSKTYDLNGIYLQIYNGNNTLLYTFSLFYTLPTGWITLRENAGLTCNLSDNILTVSNFSDVTEDAGSIIWNIKFTTNYDKIKEVNGDDLSVFGDTFLLKISYDYKSTSKST